MRIRSFPKAYIGFSVILLPGCLGFSTGTISFRNIVLQRTGSQNNKFAIKALKSDDLLGLNEPVKIGKGGAPTFSEFLKGKISGQELPENNNEVLKANIEKLSNQITKFNQDTQSLTALNSKAIKSSASDLINTLKAGSAATGGTSDFSLAPLAESLKPLIDSINLDENGVYYVGGLIALSVFGSSRSAAEGKKTKTLGAVSDTTKVKVSKETTENVDDVVIPEPSKSKAVGDRQGTGKVTRQSFNTASRSRMTKEATPNSTASVPKVDEDGCQDTSEETTENVDVVIPELSKSKAVGNRQGTGKVTRQSFNTASRSRIAKKATPDSTTSVPKVESNEMSVPKVESNEMSVPKVESDEMIKKVSMKGDEPTSILEESKMSMIMTENKLLEDKIDSLGANIASLERLLKVKDDAVAQEREKAGKEAIEKTIAKEEEANLSRKIKMLEEETNNSSTLYKRLEEEKVAIEKEAEKSNMMRLSEEENLKKRMLELEKEKDDAEAASQKLRDENSKLEKELSDKAALQSDVEILKAQIEELQTEKSAVSPMFERDVKTERTINIKKASKAEEKVRALAAEVDAKENVDDEVGLFFAAEGSSTSESDEKHPFASLSDSALSRKTVKDLVAFLEERGVQTMGENGKPYLKKILVQKVKELL